MSQRRRRFLIAISLTGFVTFLLSQTLICINHYVVTQMFPNPVPLDVQPLLDDIRQEKSKSARRESEKSIIRVEKEILEQFEKNRNQLAKIGERESILFHNLSVIMQPSYTESNIHASKLERNKNEFLIINENVCVVMPGETIVALVAVYVALEEIALRKFIRRTWGRKVKVGSKMRLVFVVGKSENNLEMSGIQEENNSHHDIIQANFIDTYRNLTLKSLALFRWTDRYCRNAKHILKIDSDMKIDLSQLMTVLQTRKIPDRFICGYLLVNHSVVRNLDSKWYVPFDTYPNEHFPNYCQGAAYITTHRIGRRIARVSVPPNPFPIDDAYITGILRESLGEGIERRIISFKHHYNQTETKVMKGDFMKYIMTVYVDGSGDKEIKGTVSLKNN